MTCVWGLDMLKSRVLYENLCYVPDEKNYLYSLLYHSLVQKHQMSEDYKERIRKMARGSRTETSDTGSFSGSSGKLYESERVSLYVSGITGRDCEF